MSAVTRLIPGIILLIAASVCWGQGTFFLKEKQVAGPQEDPMASAAYQWLGRSGTKPESIKKLPARLGKRVYYYTGTVGGREMAMLVESGKTRQLYVDTDGDGDLSDEKPFLGKRGAGALGWGWSSSYRFGPIRLKVVAPANAPTSGRQSPRNASRDKDAPSGATSSEPATDKLQDSDAKDDDASLPGSFWVEQPDLDYLLSYPASYRQGTIRIGERSVAVALQDLNFNGRYDDACQFGDTPDFQQRAADRFAIDLDGNGRFDMDWEREWEVQPLPRMLRMDDQYYSLTPSPDGAALTVEEAAPKMGTLDVGKQQIEMLLMSENGMFRLVGDSGQWQLPAGRYFFWRVVLTRMEGGKTKWTLGGSAMGRDAKGFTVAEGKTTSLKVGPPLSFAVSQRTHKALFSGKYVTFNMSCTDQAGIEYSAGADKGGKRMAPPSVKMVNEAGKTISSGQFEYG